MAQWAHYSEKDPLWIPLAEQLRSYFPDFDKIILDRTEERLRSRKTLLMTEKFYPRTGITIIDKIIHVNDADIPIRFHVPEQEPGRTSEIETFPIIFHLFPGGFVMGDFDSIETDSRKFCRNNRAIIVAIEYGLGPERPWPAGQNDVYETCKWIVQHANEFNGDIKKGFVLLGVSSGASLAALATQRARADPLLAGKITGQLNVHPTFYKLLAPPPEKYKHLMLSYEQNKDDPLGSCGLWDLSTKYYAPGNPEDPEVSPLMAESFEGLPPAAFLISGADRLKDEALLYAQLSAEAGVPVKVEVYSGFGHGFHVVSPHLEITKKYLRDIDDSLKWLLSLAPNSSQ